MKNTRPFHLGILLLMLMNFNVNAQSIYDFTSIVDGSESTFFKIPSTHDFQYLVHETEFNTPDKYDFTAFVPIAGSSSNGYLSINHENTNGGVTVFDIAQNTATKVWSVSNPKAVRYGEVQRPCSGAVTSWGAVLSAEESSLGRILETDPATGNSIWRYQLGRLAHENVAENTSNNRTFYTGEDTNSGVLLKFVADNPGDLSAGSLYALDLNASQTGGTWDLIPNNATTDTHAAAINSGASTFSGIEDVEISPIDGKVVFAVKGSGIIYRFTEDTPLGGGTVSNFETFVSNTTYNTGNGTAAWGTGIDNLAFDNAGNLWAFQDGGDHQMWVIENGHTPANPKVKLFGQAPSGAEPTGITFTPDFNYMFMSFQHPSGNASTSQPDVFGNTVPNNLDFAIVIARNETWANNTSVTTLGLGNFNSNCGVQNITGAVETSGVTYNSTTKTFFAVSDNLSVYELDLNGALLRTISMSGFQDTEGIVWLGGNQYGITEERRREVVVVTITSATNSLSYPGASGVIAITDNGVTQNNGFEGLAYDAVNDILYIAKEGDEDTNNTGVEPAVYKVANPLGQVGTTISNPIVAFTNLPSCTNFDASGLAMSPTGSLLLLTEQCDILYEIDPNNGTVLSQKNISGFTFPEGVTMVDDNQIWVIGEDNQISQFVIPGSTCDDGNPNTTGDVFNSSCACQGTPTTTCITQLPAQESFETDFGIWNQDTSDDLNWTRNSGGTGSSGTGPSGASDGTFYAYIEASGNGSGYPNKTAILVSDCFDISTNGGAQITFDYHMLGNATTMNLDFDVTTDNGTTWTTLWTATGSQGNQWNLQTIDLTPYVNQSVQFRFFGTTGTTWSGDISIDAINISLGGGGCPTAGQACNDGDTCTINDVFDNTPACNCAGVDSGDADGDGVCAAQDPDDNDACNPNIIDVDNDNICDLVDSCPNFNNNLIGTACDDGNPNTTGDVYTVNCICEGTATSGCITQLPAQESFETDFGIWNQDGSDNMDWTRLSGSTGSNGTGPTAASDGSFYAYIEASGTGYPNKTAILVSDCFDIPTTGGAQIDFDYHMFGNAATMNLDFDVSTNNGATWTTLWTATGSQGNQWNAQTIDLSSYVNQAVLFRFFGTTGTSFSSDIAIDAINISLNGGGCPTAGQACNDGDPCTINDVFDNTAACNCAGVDSGDADGDGVCAAQDPDDNDACNPNIIDVDNDNICDLVDSCPNFNNNLIGTACDDGNPNTSGDVYTNNCICEGTPVSGCITQTPAQESFESDFGIWNQDGNDDLDWTRNSGGTGSSGTGPSAASDGTFYAYIEASGSGTGFPTKTAILVSDCFDIPTTGGAQIDFDYHMFGNATTLNLDFDVTTDNGSTWTNLWSVTGSQGNQWNTQTVDLSQYVNQQVQFRFFGTTGTTWSGDISIDAINISLNSGNCNIAGQPCDDGDPCTINDVYDNAPECNCFGTYSGDTDGDGICDAQDSCPTLNNNLIGTACNDGNSNTTGDVYTNNCICEGTPVNATSIDLTLFNSSCGIQNIAGAVETSGLTYNPTTGTLFAVSDNLSVYELDLTGALIRTIGMSGFQDTEGIVWLGGTQFGITEERRREIVIVNITTTTNTLTYPGASGVIAITDSGVTQNNGFEGLAYDNVNDVLYVAKEGDEDDNNTGVEPRVYRIANPLAQVGTTIASPVDAFANFPNCTFFDASGLAMSSSGSLLLITEQCDILYELDPANGAILSQKTISGFSFPEGVTMVDDNQIWVLGEGNQISQFVIPGSTCDDGDPNTTGDVFALDCTCQGTVTMNCITQLPAQESFEADFGIWNQVTGTDNLNWTRNSGGTGSSGTGPSGASDGSFYAYIEASGNGTGYPTKTAILVSDCFDIPTTGGAQIDFDYHMYGASSNMNLAFDVSTDDGATWTNLWSITGDQGNQWNSQTINLTSYVNQSVLFRFFGTTGLTWSGDISIDAINIDLNSGMRSEFNEAEVETPDNTAMKIYPNPASDKIFIDMGKEMVADGVILLYDANGRLVRELTFQAGAASLFELNTNSVCNGLYHISVITDGNLISSDRVIILK